MLSAKEAKEKTEKKIKEFYNKHYNYLKTLIEGEIEKAINLGECYVEVNVFETNFEERITRSVLDAIMLELAQLGYRTKYDYNLSRLVITW